MKYYVPGIFLIASSLLIIAFPQILVAIVSACIFMAGITALGIGNLMKHYDRELKARGEGGFVNIFFRGPGRW
ncbi:MAG: hypothetical protein B5M56_10465 [Desulfococcus sp. 4484_241]|nr:MAG: hypothetical protein B5M56_10465 [Desulfococcus sp. 4484_241]